jgi:hypothetical protein
MAEAQFLTNPYLQSHGKEEISLDFKPISLPHTKVDTLSPKPSMPPHFLQDSLILNKLTKLDRQLLFDLVGFLCETTLLYRGSRDGFGAEDFHRKCNNQGPTLLLVRSAERGNHVFGAFTNVPWTSSSMNFSDKGAFLFQLFPHKTRLCQC